MNEVKIDASGTPIAYLTKITKTEVIPLYREVVGVAETGDIVCATGDKSGEYAKRETYPFQHIVPADGTPYSEAILNENMEVNLLALGIRVEGAKAEKLNRVSNPVPRLPPEAIENLERFYVKTVVDGEAVPVDEIPAEVEAKVAVKAVRGDDGVEYVLSDEKDGDDLIYHLKNRGKGRAKQFVIRDGKFIGLKELRDMEKVAAKDAVESVKGDDGVEYVLSCVMDGDDPIYHLKNHGRGRAKQFVKVGGKFVIKKFFAPHYTVQEVHRRHSESPDLSPV